jgi:hypothetical protein
MPSQAFHRRLFEQKIAKIAKKEEKETKGGDWCNAQSSKLIMNS